MHKDPKIRALLEEAIKEQLEVGDHFVKAGILDKDERKIIDERMVEAYQGVAKLFDNLDDYFKSTFKIVIKDFFKSILPDEVVKKADNDTELSMKMIEALRSLDKAKKLSDL